MIFNFNVSCKFNSCILICAGTPGGGFFNTVSKVGVTHWNQFAPDMAIPFFNSRPAVVNDYVGDADLLADRCCFIASSWDTGKLCLSRRWYSHLKRKQ